MTHRQKQFLLSSTKLLSLTLLSALALSSCKKDGDYVSYLCSKYKGFTWNYEEVQGDAEDGYGYSEGFTATADANNGLVLTHTGSTDDPYFGWSHDYDDVDVGPIGNGNMNFELSFADIDIADSHYFFAYIDGDGSDEDWYAEIYVYEDETYLYIEENHNLTFDEVTLTGVVLSEAVLGVKRENGVLTVYAGDPNNASNYISLSTTGYPNEAAELDFYMGLYDASPASGASVALKSITIESEGPSDGNYPSVTTFECGTANAPLVAGINADVNGGSSSRQGKPVGASRRVK